MNFYEINEETLAIIPIDYEKTKVIELNNEYIVDKKAYQVMDESCQYYGSTYKGRLTAAKKILECAYKIPILVEETQSIIFFPTKSSLEEDCCWINFNQIKKIEKRNNDTLVTFNNNKEILFGISKLSIENQISRSTRLGYLIQQRLKKQQNIN